ncbi:MAG TPA: 4Fe-4S binding protein [Chloroflexi bacterium]|jgi:2-oxoglutarate ferredoxin oxidoreductase subunit delta|nr:4Fe-4S binding protein [Chloroflexota bacterium]
MLKLVRVEIDRTLCNGCNVCVHTCPRDVLAIDGAQWTGGFHPVKVAAIGRCTACRNCEALCPTHAIRVAV